MLAFYSDTFVLPLPPDHRFPMSKYALLRQKIVAEGTLLAESLRLPEPATDAQILRVHSHDYWWRLQSGTLTAQEQRRIGFPWSPQMVVRTRHVAGGTIAACRAALDDGMAFNLAGGTHHAHSDFGAGYCVTNDSAIAVRAVQAEKRVRRVVIIDCDVHQGDGTARIFAGDPSVFTFSIHGEKNFPFHKAHSSLDIELRDGTRDDEYLSLVDEGVRRALVGSGPIGVRSGRAEEPPDGAQAVVAIRLPGFDIAENIGDVAARVISRRFLGVVELVELAVQGLDMPLRARVRCGSLSSAARDVWLSVRKSDVLVFESDGENA